MVDVSLPPSATPLIAPILLKKAAARVLALASWRRHTLHFKRWTTSPKAGLLVLAFTNVSASDGVYWRGSIGRELWSVTRRMERALRRKRSRVFALGGVCPR
jgi:hypothetical protein